MQKAKVKKLTAEKGYGFLTPIDGGKDVFFHHSAVDGRRFNDLSEGDLVEFELDSAEPERGKGPKAAKVRMT